LIVLESDEVKEEDSTDEEEEDRKLLKQITDDHKKELKKLVQLTVFGCAVTGSCCAVRVV
jgi:hypothetical protein